MKKINYLLLPLIILIFVTSCSGYKPIFSASKLEFEIVDYDIKGNKKLGSQIYSKLFILSKSKKNSPNIRSLYAAIEILKNKNATAKNSAGKVLEYKINLSANVELKDYSTGDVILNQNFVSYSSYKVQDQHSETITLENKIVDDLLNKIYEDLLIRISESI
tara:strand:+ start:1835 stop:2320 length:486 start_codon:yes stop_codon:yes gene_type:complete